MATAFVLIKTDLGKEEQLMEEIKKTEELEHRIQRLERIIEDKY